MGERRAQERHPGRMTRAALLIFLIAWTAQAGAQSFPSRPIHFAVAFAPGGIADTIARGVGQKMSERIGQPVVVETKSGAGGMRYGQRREQRECGAADGLWGGSVPD